MARCSAPAAFTPHCCSHPFLALIPAPAPTPRCCKHPLTWREAPSPRARMALAPRFNRARRHRWLDRAPLPQLLVAAVESSLAPLSRHGSACGGLVQTDLTGLVQTGAVLCSGREGSARPPSPGLPSPPCLSVTPGWGAGHQIPQHSREKAAFQNSLSEAPPN